MQALSAACGSGACSPCLAVVTGLSTALPSPQTWCQRRPRNWCHLQRFWLRGLEQNLPCILGLWHGNAVAWCLLLGSAASWLPSWLKSKTHLQIKRPPEFGCRCSHRGQAWGRDLRFPVQLYPRTKQTVFKGCLLALVCL